jgi:hypothetical protein
VRALCTAHYKDAPRRIRIQSWAHTSAKLNERITEHRFTMLPTGTRLQASEEAKERREA